MKTDSITSIGVARVRQSTRVVGLAIVVSLGVLVGDSIGSLLETCSSTALGTCTESCTTNACRNVIGGKTCDASAEKDACMTDVGVCNRWNNCPGMCLDNVTECECPTSNNICG